MVTLFDTSAAVTTPAVTATDLVDPFGRHVTYLRLSVTDRCDLRCTYCMSERMTFLPKRELLDLGELDQLATAFIERGVKRLRITGGEPLVRRDIIHFIEGLSRHLESGALDELTLTTNATQLKPVAGRLAAAGVRRINVSLDSLDPDRYREITRGGDLGSVLDALEEAQAHGIRVKLNAVALRNGNVDELPQMIEWAHARDMDVTLIEAMPMGETGEDRTDQHIPLTEVLAEHLSGLSLSPLSERTGGPARYFRVAETGGKLGLITPLSHNFCEACNRVRVTCTGQLYMCLGQEDAADLRAVMRGNPGDRDALNAAIDEAISRKPKGHDFVIDREQGPSSPRHMSVTGG